MEPIQLLLCILLLSASGIGGQEDGIPSGDDPINKAAYTTRGYSGTTSSDRLGVIMSPGYPGNYPNNYRFRYDIYLGKQESDVEINFKIFDLEYCSNCDCDYIEIENYKLAKPLKYCGAALPNGDGQVFLNNLDDYVWITFQSNSDQRRPGFYATYEVTQRAGNDSFLVGGSVCPPVSCPYCNVGQTPEYDYTGVCTYCFCSKYRDNTTPYYPQTSLCPPVVCPACPYGFHRHMDYTSYKCTHCYCVHDQQTTVNGTWMQKTTSSYNPWSYLMTSHRPWQTTTHRPWQTTSHRPWQTTSHRPWRTTSYRPWLTTSHRPWQTTSYRPWQTTSHRPWQTTSHRPWQTTSHRPWRTTSHRPWQTTSHRPWRTTSYRPWLTTSHRPWQTTSYRPWQTTSHRPWQTTSHRPWRTTSYRPWLTTSHRPWVPASTTYPLRSQTATHYMWETTTASYDYDCGPSYFRNRSGVIMSPGVPGHAYPNNRDCRYDIDLGGVPGSRKTVALTFNFFDLETCSSCTCDSLTISSEETDHLRMCDGSMVNTSRTYYVHKSSDILKLHFTTDSSVVRSGFSVNYEVLSSEVSDTCGSDTCSTCNGLIHQDYFGCCICSDRHYETTTSRYYMTSTRAYSNSLLLQMLNNIVHHARMVEQYASDLENEANNAKNLVANSFG
ncbi:uncharacterized protein LOC117321683 [Pecten maximus]|uniref:uncharacterized protein LOC117321683 n=1 Tax=Pecten maximus TaxID=6579 RepID=UPI001458C08A|nr:uncharacterized protein LOC117321683 [Pecten maximus]